MPNVTAQARGGCSLCADAARGCTDTVVPVRRYSWRDAEKTGARPCVVALALLVLALPLASGPALAQLSQKPIQIIVPFAPGASADGAARIVANDLGPRLGRQVVVEHKAGGEGGTTAAPAVVIGAILDALRDYGVRDIKMPATPYNVWKAIAAANADREAGKK